MVKISLRSRKRIGLDFYEFLKETNRESITERDELTRIYKEEFKIRNDPNFSSVLYALKFFGKVKRTREVVHFESTVTDLYLDPWPAQNGAARPGPAQPAGRAEDATTGVRARRNLANLLKDELQMNRAHLISDKHGVSINSDHQSNDGEIHFSVEGATMELITLTVENTGNRPVHFTYYTPLHWLRDFTLYDEHNVTRANPRQLNPGEEYAIQVRYQCSLARSSFLATLLFEFRRDLRSNPAFHIVRYIKPHRYPDPSVSLLHADHEYTDVCQKCRLFYNQLVALAPHKCTALERSTVRQRHSHLWFDSRRVRITASMAKKLLHCRGEPAMSNYIEEHVKPSFHGNKATEHGIEGEEHAYQWLENQGYAVRRSGTVVCASEPWLSASPDGVLDSTVLLEIKCPYKDLDELMRNPGYDFQRENGEIVLKKNGVRGYYNQVQLGMFCTGLRACEMLIWHPPREPILLNVPYEEQLCNDMVDKLRRIYFKKMLVYLTDMFQAGDLWLSASYLRFCEE